MRVDREVHNLLVSKVALEFIRFVAYLRTGVSLNLVCSSCGLASVNKYRYIARMLYRCGRGYSGPRRT